MPPNNKFIRVKTDTYIIENIINKRKKNNKVEYLIKWKGFNEKNYISSKELDRTKDLREMKKEFNLTFQD